MARMSAPGGHDRNGLLGRIAGRLLPRGRKQPPPPIARPAHLAPVKGGINLDPLNALRRKPVYRAKPAKVYTDVVPGSCAANRCGDADGRRTVQRWALAAAATDDLVLFRDRATAMRHQRLLRRSGLPVLLTLRVGRYSALGARLSRFQVANGNVLVSS